jgi:hypothetical protein
LNGLPVSTPPPQPASPPHLPPQAVAELHAALIRLRGERGRLVRAARIVGRLAATPMLRRLGGLAGAGWILERLAYMALERAFGIAVLGLPERGEPLAPLAGPRAAHLATAVSGAVSGAAGLIGAGPDAALTTLLMMRQIAAIALQEGEDLTREDARRACLEVFALDASGEGGYWGARLLLRGAPLASVLAQAARVWSVGLAEKLAAQVAPLAGAAGGVLVNTAFLAHYRALARAHFTVRRLERTYGAEAVRAAAERWR